MEVNLIDINRKTYFLNEKYVLLYLISLIGIIFAGIIAITVLGLPRLLGIKIELISIIVIIVCLIPFLIFWIIPKNKKYLEW